MIVSDLDAEQGTVEHRHKISYGGVHLVDVTQAKQTQEEVGHEQD